VADVHIYLAPFDVWTASVFSFSDLGPDNPANLITFDNSCTVPAIKGNSALPALFTGAHYLPFRNDAYSGVNDDAGVDSLERGRAGYFEMIEMGEVVDRGRGSLTAITHSPFGSTPANCAQIQRAWLGLGSAPAQDTYWTANALIDIDPPQGGLSGAAAIIDALAGTMLSYNADAIDGFSDIAQHTPGPSITVKARHEEITEPRPDADGCACRGARAAASDSTSTRQGTRNAYRDADSTGAENDASHGHRNRHGARDRHGYDARHRDHHRHRHRDRTRDSHGNRYGNRNQDHHGDTNACLRWNRQTATTATPRRGNDPAITAPRSDDRESLQVAKGQTVARQGCVADGDLAAREEPEYGTSGFRTRLPVDIQSKAGSSRELQDHAVREESPEVIGHRQHRGIRGQDRA